MGLYRIRVKGHLEPGLLDGMEIASSGDDETIISGRFADREALRAALMELRSLGVILVSVVHAELPDRAGSSTSHGNPGAL